jgi:hypothetical protein
MYLRASVSALPERCGLITCHWRRTYHPRLTRKKTLTLLDVASETKRCSKQPSTINLATCQNRNLPADSVEEATIKMGPILRFHRGAILAGYIAIVSSIDWIAKRVTSRQGHKNGDTGA